MNLREEIDRLRPFSVGQEREAMGRGVQFPTVQGRVLILEQELARTRDALREALDLLEPYATPERAFGRTVSSYLSPPTVIEG